MTVTIQMTNHKTIDLSVRNVGQSWLWDEIRLYESVEMIDPDDSESGWGESTYHRLRASIRRNAYNDQSYANIEKWSDERGWVIINSHGIAEMPCASVSYVMKELDDDKQDLFIQTADFLFGIGERFIGIDE